MTPNGAAIKALREARGMSLRRLAHLTTRDPGYLHRLETGQRSAGRTTVQLIATALDVPVAAITREPETEGNDP